jgi:hypothetical protein
MCQYSLSNAIGVDKKNKTIILRGFNPSPGPREAES